MDRLRPHPSERFADVKHLFDLEREAEALGAERDSGQHGHRQKALYSRGPLTVGLFTFEADSKMPDHVVEGEVLIQVLEGRLSVKTSEGEEEVSAGQVLVLAPGVRHDLTARERTRMLLTVVLEEDAVDEED